VSYRESIVASRQATMAERLSSRTWRVSRKPPPDETVEELIDAIRRSWYRGIR